MKDLREETYLHHKILVRTEYEVGGFGGIVVSLLWELPVGRRLPSFYIRSDFRARHLGWRSVNSQKMKRKWSMYCLVIYALTQYTY